MAAVNRFRFTDSTVKQAKMYLKDGKGTQPAFLKRFKGHVKDGRLYLDDKMVVPRERVDSFLRNKIFAGKTPMSRDAAYYWIKQNTVGVSRSATETFLRKQRIIRATDNQQATTKRAARRVNTKGQLHIDLIELKFKDLQFEPTVPRTKRKLTKAEQAEGEEEAGIKKGYWFGVVDSLTSLAWYKFAPYKKQKFITPIAKEGFKWMSDKLGVPMNKLSLKMDAGTEFNLDKYREWGLRVIVVKQDPFIEGKNSHFQRVLFRIAKMNKTRHLGELTTLATTQLNRTVSSVSKKAPIQNVKEGVKTLAKTYNKKRGTGSGVKVRLRPLVPGTDKVRIRLLHEKDKIMYKAYQGKMWSGRLYKVGKRRGDRYIVNRKLFHRDDLRLTENYDQKTEQLLEKRKHKL